MSGTDPSDADLLTPFEIRNLPEEYRRWYATKRNNLFATIQASRSLWDLYVAIDSLWRRDLGLMQAVSSAGSMLPLVLYMASHSKSRIAMELLFSGCAPEGCSVLRDSVESAAHAHFLVEHPDYQETWLNKNESKSDFEKAFMADKGKKLFRSAPNLHKAWKTLSEIGSHSNVNSLAAQFKSTRDAVVVEFRYQYFCTDHEAVGLRRLTAIRVVGLLQEVFFQDFHDRLQMESNGKTQRTDFWECMQLAIADTKSPRPAAKPKAARVKTTRCGTKS